MFLKFLLSLLSLLSSFFSTKKTLSANLKVAHKNIDDLFDTANYAAQAAIKSQEVVARMQKKTDDEDEEAIISSIIAERMRNQLVVTADDITAYRRGLVLSTK